MRYNKFTIKNFKGIRKMVLDLNRSPRSNVFALVGLNESGKTTILEAMHWLHESSGYDPVSLIPKSELFDFNGTISVCAEIGFVDEDERAISDYLSRKGFNVKGPVGGMLITRECCYETSSLVDEKYFPTISIEGKTSRMKELASLPKDKRYYDRYYQPVEQYILTRLMPSTIYYENFLFDFPDKLYLRTREGQEMTREDQFYRNVIQDVMNSMRGNLNPDTHLVDRYLSGTYSDRRAMGALLDKLGAKITTLVIAAWRELLKYEGTGLSITLGRTLEEDDKGYYIQVQVQEGDQTYLIRERSLGFRWFFSFVLFTHFRAYRHSHRKSALFLLDEPAYNLHQTAQSKVLAAFEELPYKQDVIYATHSHHMINPKWLAGTFVIRNKAKEYVDVDVAYNSHKTDIKAERYFRFVAHYPGDRDYYRPILDSLDYQPSQLEFVPELVMLEGKNDFYTLKYVKEMGLVDSSIGDYLYPGTGKDKLDYLIGLYIGWARNFVVLLDDDRGGRQTYGRLLNEFGALLKNRLFTLADVNSDWSGFAMESVFIKPDRLKVIQTLYPEQDRFHKSKFNTALQDAWINERRIKLHLHTIKRFQKLFAFLEDKLAENRIRILNLSTPADQVD